MNEQGMRRLGALDASFLALDGPSSGGHLHLLMPLDRPLRLADLTAAVEERAAGAPLLRERLVSVPLGAGRPFWEHDPDVLVAENLYEHEVDGSPQSLADWVAGSAGVPLDRDRPLWEMHLLHGVGPRRAGDAVVLKIHHAAVDGLGVLDLMDSLLDPPAGSTPGHPTSDRAPAARHRRGRLDTARRWGGLVDLPRALATTSVTAARSGIRGSFDRMVYPGSLARPPFVSAPYDPAPPSPFNRAVGDTRTAAFGDVPLEQARALRASHGASVNDVVLAAVTVALRGWLSEHDRLPDRPLRAAVPVAVSAEPDVRTANRIGMLTGAIPVHVANPEHALLLVHEQMRAAKRNGAHAEESAERLAQWAVPAVAGPAMRVVRRLHLADRLRLPYNLMVSNVRGWTQPRSLCGRRVLGLYPVPVVADGLGLNITVQSYTDRLCYGVVSTRDIVPDPWDLLARLQQAHAELAALASA